MAQPLPPDFKEFLALLNSEKIEYLIVGGYAVSYYGYPRPTGDLDVLVAVDPGTASKLVSALTKVGVGGAGATREMFITPGRIGRVGVPPGRIEGLNSASGGEFAACRAR